MVSHNSFPDMSGSIESRDFVRDQEGAITTFGLSLLLLAFVLGGLSLDVAYAYQVKTRLQATADAAAHAALLTRELGSVEEARDAALNIAQSQMPVSQYGDVLQPTDIQFGSWDSEENVFTADNSLKDAVLVTTKNFKSNNNSVPLLLLGLVGIKSWDVQAAAVFETYMPACFREGFVAQGIVDMQSNNSFTNGFCIHSNAHVEVNNNNSFADSTIVSMPDINSLVMPSSGFDKNAGLEAALVNQRYNFRILERLDEIFDDLWYARQTYVPDYITSFSTVKLSGSQLDAGDFLPGRIHSKTCKGGRLTIKANTVLQDIVLITDCEIKFGSKVGLENVIIATTDTGAKSISAASGLRIGRDDGCATDGGAQILTMGSVSVPAKMQLYGGQIIAKGDISFAANANGIEGASLIAGGKIDGTSNMTMGFCGNGMERNFEADFFRLRG